MRPSRERGRLARMHRRRESLSMSTMWQPATPSAGTALSRRRCRSRQVEEVGEAVPGRVRAGRPRSRVGCLFQLVLLFEEACVGLPGLIPADGAEP